MENKNQSFEAELRNQFRAAKGICGVPNRVAAAAVGVDQSSIGHWLAGRRPLPPVPQLRLWAKVYELDLLLAFEAAHKVATEEPEEHFGHEYPGSPHGTSDCAFGCGCWAGPYRSGGPDGVDPFGPCPNNPAASKAAEEVEP